jgi:regulator of sirC expression with transglutaminase-like and TPR domain
MNSLNQKEISEIQSLIKLLDDEESVFQIAKGKLLEYGESALPYLPNDQSQSRSIFVQRSSEIREELLRLVFKVGFILLKKDSNRDLYLEDALFLIARYRYPELDITPYSQLLNLYARELKEKTSTVLDPMDIFQCIISFFIEEKQFLGNIEDYYNEENHYINKVLDTKRGIPISLSIIYLLICRKINLPVCGIGLPGHFILRFSFDQHHIYFDPFNNGQILQKKDCMVLVENLGYIFSEQFLESVSNRQIIERVLRNIIVSLEKKNELNRIETVRQFIDTLNSDV